ncbi:uncharacterized protein LOC114405026 [Glycine soja]|uniref:uncharacterized protein LOC114405026 n=1 Tax=Glycine soja TaxID=3848 RepID=UPI00103B8538|nr:uncharacterized protein LOC114405026 [Glycine soja]
MAEEQPRRVTLEDYSSTFVPQYFLSVARPEVQAQNLTYPPSLIQLIQCNLFHGLPNEDPYSHLATYIEICNTVKLAGVPEDAIRLSLFSFSLSGGAKRWLHSFKGNSLKTWDEFPDESLSEELERFHSLLRKTPTHGFSEPIQLNIFIDGLRSQSEQLLDAYAGGKIKLKTPGAAMDLIENMAASDHTILHDRVTSCTLFDGAHGSGLYIPTEETSHEVNYMGNQPRQNFNAGGFSGLQHGQPYQQHNQWRTHPGNQFNKDQGGLPNRLQQQGPSLSERTTKLEETLAQFMQVSLTNHKSTESAIKNLEVQVGQLSKQLAEKSSSTFGANTEQNPKEECKAVMTRGRKVAMEEEEKKKKMVEDDKQQLAIESAPEPVQPFCELIEKEEEEEDEQMRETPIILKRHLARFLDIFKKLEITMPFGEALQHMPLYAKFLKDMLTRKNKYIHSNNIIVEGNYSSVIQQILPPKHKDPGSVTIPRSIGEVSIGKTLIDLGANINLMPLSMCWRLGELEIMPTRMTLQLADRSITKPYGVIEDVLVRVKHLIFPADFVVMYIEEDADIPLILGRPFMSTARCVVDMGKKKLEMGFEDQQISFDLFNEERKLLDHNVCL